MEVFRGRSGGAQREEGCEEDRMKQQHTSGRVAAFFDLDGTLLARPSLERRFFGGLPYPPAVPVEEYFLWLGAGAGVAAARTPGRRDRDTTGFSGFAHDAQGVTKR